MNARTIIVAAIASATIFRAGTVAASQSQVIDFGIYTANTVSFRADTNSPTGRVRRGTVELTKQTTEIPAKLGTLFGFRFTVTDDLRKAPLKFVFLIPEMKNPNTQKTFSSYERSGYEKSPLETQAVLYHLSESYELVPGEWTFQVFSGSQKVHERKFNVVKAN
jgi:hypothetical protein